MVIRKMDEKMGKNDGIKKADKIYEDDKIPNLIINLPAIENKNDNEYNPVCMCDDPVPTGSPQHYQYSEKGYTTIDGGD